jgi:hypothetical protein
VRLEGLGQLKNRSFEGATTSCARRLLVCYVAGNMEYHMIKK